MVGQGAIIVVSYGMNALDAFRLDVQVLATSDPDNPARKKYYLRLAEKAMDAFPAGDDAQSYFKAMGPARRRCLTSPR